MVTGNAHNTFLWANYLIPKQAAYDFMAVYGAE